MIKIANSPWLYISLQVILVLLNVVLGESTQLRYNSGFAVIAITSALCCMYNAKLLRYENDKQVMLKELNKNALKKHLSEKFTSLIDLDGEPS